MELKKCLFDGFTIDVLRQYQQLNANSSHVDDRAGTKSIMNVSRLQCHGVQSVRAKGMPRQCTILAAKNMCRSGASFLLRLSRPNDLNPPEDENANQHALTRHPRTVVFESKPRIMET